MRAPKPFVLARHLRAVADMLDEHGDHAVDTARILAARGYPASTLGDGGSRGSDPTSTTERAALNQDPHANTDQILAGQLRRLWKAGLDVQAVVTRILAHGGDDDRTPAADCARCGTVVRPTPDHPERRLRSGYCPRCHRQWLRLGRPERGWFRVQDDEQLDNAG